MLFNGMHDSQGWGQFHQFQFSLLFFAIPSIRFKFNFFHFNSNSIYNHSTPIKIPAPIHKKYTINVQTGGDATCHV